MNSWSMPKCFGNYYGTARRFLREAEHSGHDLLLDIDVQGAAQIKQQACRTRSASSFCHRTARAGMAAAEPQARTAKKVIQRRLQTAKREIENYDKYDYILVNDHAGKSIERLQAIVLSERLRRETDTVEEESATVERAEPSSG